MGQFVKVSQVLGSARAQGPLRWSGTGTDKGIGTTPGRVLVPERGGSRCLGFLRLRVEVGFAGLGYSQLSTRRNPPKG